MIRVLFVNHSNNIGGAEINLLNIVRSAEDHGILPVGLALPGPGPLAEAAKDLDLPVYKVSYHAFRWRNPFRYLQTLTRLAGLMRRSKADIVHLNHQWLVEHVVSAGQLVGIPVICHNRNYPDTDFVQENRRWLEAAAAFIVESNAVRTRALALGLPNEKLCLIPNGVEICANFASNSRETARKKLGLESDRPVIAFSGRIVNVKGVEDLLASLPLVLQSVPQALCLLAGRDEEDGRYVGRLECMVQDLEITDHVRFLGFRPDITALLPAFDVLAVPSRPAMAEGLPLSALEGMAAGCIVVATPNSGLPEAIEEGVTGFLVAPEDPPALAGVLVKALTLPDYNRRQIQATATDRISTNFSLEQQVANLAGLYSDLLS